MGIFNMPEFAVKKRTLYLEIGQIISSFGL